MGDSITIATRGSRLALWQSEHVAECLRNAHPDLTVNLKIISTKGDQQLDKALSKIGDKGLFTAELEDALRSGDADIAVHSLKDLPTELPEGLALVAVPKREDSRDLLVIRSELSQDRLGGLRELPEGTILGTSSLRRKAQALRQNKGLRVKDIRGNVETRLRKVVDGEYEATLLAAAGLLRLGIVKHDPWLFEGEYADHLQVIPLDCPSWLPAASQGALGIEGRAGDSRVAEVMSAINDDAAYVACEIERSVLSAMEGGCQVPIGIFSQWVSDGSALDVHAGVYALDGQRAVVKSDTIDANSGDISRLLGMLNDEGAKELLRAARE